MADPKSPIGGPCASVDDCDQLEANLCLPNVGSPPVGLCTRACSSPTSCPNDYCCQEFEGGGSTLCLPTAMCLPECTCDVTSGQCDQGCACDLACVNQCSCDVSMGCEANCSCDPNCTGGCTCDTSQACEANCSCDPNCNTGPCNCDATFACDKASDGVSNCACDPECGPCNCDATFACDSNCACDPECNGIIGGGRDPRGCGCTAVEKANRTLVIPPRPEAEGGTHGATWLSLVLVTLLGIAFTRRKP
jgi:hypothetical protein